MLNENRFLGTFRGHNTRTKPCNKSDNAIKLVSLLQVVNSLFQTCYNNWEQAVRTQLVNRFVTTCFQTCNNLCVFSTCARRIKILQLVNKMCSHCLFPVVDKSGTSVIVLM